MSDLYYIQSPGPVVGNSVLWWKPYGCGYTCNLDEAGLYEREEADEIERLRRGDKAWPVSVVEDLVERHVDIQRLRAVKDQRPQEDTDA